MSASEDQSAVVWDYKKGIPLRTYLLRSIPRALVLDRSDRGCYTAYDDGSVQTIDFYAEGQHANTLYDEDITTAVQPGDAGISKAEGQELGEVLSLALSWDGCRLLSGHKSGKIASWDVGKGSFMSIVETLPGTAANIVMTPIHGLVSKKYPNMRLLEIVKPRISTVEAQGIIPGDYTLSAQLIGSNHVTRPGRITRPTRFQSALSHPSLPSSFLEAGLAELSRGSLGPAKAVNGHTAQSDEPNQELAAVKAQNETLQQQIEHLQKLQKASFAQLREKNKALSALVSEQEHLAEIAKAEHGWNIVDANIEWHKYQQRRKGPEDVHGKQRSNDEEMADAG